MSGVATAFSNDELSTLANAVIRIGTPSASQTLTLTTATTDSGPLAIDFAARDLLTIGVATLPPCTKNSTLPSDTNVIVQYRAR